MTHSESSRYNMCIILGTENGELPSDEEVKQLVIDQLAGELDETTGLFCIDVEYIEDAEASD